MDIHYREHLSDCNAKKEENLRKPPIIPGKNIAVYTKRYA